ncbi:unnamed protein product [Dibothriocephalus latus]|uniref:Nuclear condensin complex subunit 3 C-terminal domain-containing protein n=1 Tax=Dibothriocephalus latus TaxID=60516 RepID=A0A3P7LV32_DIBLA|nr:unnamed protein product [Dibothriocephalus latus]
MLVSIKAEPDAIEIIDTEEEEEEDDQTMAPHLKLIQAQLQYLGRLPSDVILKANKMVLFTLQKSSTLWCLPPSLRSLVYTILLPSIQHKDFLIRKEALLALGLTCTMDLALTKHVIRTTWHHGETNNLIPSFLFQMKAVFITQPQWQRIIWQSGSILKFDIVCPQAQQLFYTTRLVPGELVARTDLLTDSPNL